MEQEMGRSAEKHDSQVVTLREQFSRYRDAQDKLAAGLNSQLRIMKEKTGEGGGGKVNGTVPPRLRKADSNSSIDSSNSNMSSFSQSGGTGGGGGAGGNSSASIDLLSWSGGGLGGAWPQQAADNSAAAAGGGSNNGLKLQTHMLVIDASPDPLARFNEVNRSKKQRRLQLQPQHL
jgi:hypothetical protein